MASSGTKQVTDNRRAVYDMESIGDGGTSHNVVFEHKHVNPMGWSGFAHPHN